MVTLVQIELQNFKTFIGNHVLKIIGKFAVVTGPNGAGKSNMADAIAFAMGAKFKALRVSKMEQLAHTSVSKSQGMFVQIVLQIDDGSKHCFKRSVSGSNCRCSINNKEMTFSDYEEALRKLNINSRVNNFLVFQDSIESIILKRPNERTKIFEEISGSGALKPEYDCLKGQLLQYYEEHETLFSTKRSLSKDLKIMRSYQRQAKEYLQLSKQNEAARLQLLLFNLYHVRRTTESLSGDEHELKKTINDHGKRKYDKEKELGQMLADCERLARKCAEREATCKPRELEVKKIADELEKIRATKEHLEKRAGACKQSYQSAIKADGARQSTVRDLENALAVAQHEKYEYIKRYSKTLGRDVQLSESQIKEYEKLKLSVYAACATNNNRLFVLDREYTILKDVYDNENTKLNEVSITIDNRRIRKDAVTARIEKLEQAVRKTQTDLDMKCATYEKLVAMFEYSKRKEQILTKEIDEINTKLSDFESDERNSTRKEEEIVEKLRNLFPGVYKPLGDLCWPIHNRYNVAVAKVLGAKANWIIVDESKTARQCIKYLKDNRIGVRTFLPLDQLRQVNLSENLRYIRHPPNVKLIYDVIEFSIPEIARAVFHATENTLVCETAEDASKVAYESSKRHNCVSLDGCYYKKSGIMSGGGRDLASKAVRWDLKEKKLLEEKKENQAAKLRENLKTTPKQSELSLLAETIERIKLYSQYTVKDRIDAYKELNTVENELKTFEERNKVIENGVAEAKANMDDAFDAMRDLKSDNDAKETEIFADFCRSLGVRNIQEYEDGKKSFEKRINEFGQQIDRIKVQLSFESNRDTKINVARWEGNLNKIKNELDLVVPREKNTKSSFDEATKNLETVQNEYRNSLNLLMDKEKQILQLKDEIAAIARKYISLSKTRYEIQHNIAKMRADFHALLTDAKVSGFPIATDDRMPSLSQSSTTSSNNSLSETYELEAKMQIDFSKLPVKLRDLDGAEVAKARDTLEKTLVDLWEKIDAITEPNMRTSEHLNSLEEKLSETIRKLETNREMMANTRAPFDRVKEERSNLFTQFFDQVSNRVDIIHKRLTGNSAAQTYLMPENPEEPYLAGIYYDCVVPGKRFQPNDQLSGGEKTMAALPLLFAIQSIDDKQPPFEVFDEIDAALDHSNATKVARYMKREKENQTIVISHKKELIATADALIGITSPVDVGSDSRVESNIFTFLLSPFPERITR